MSDQFVSALGITVPEDFPLVAYEAVATRINARQSANPIAWPEFAGAWNAVAYRFRGCTEYHQSYTESVRREGDAQAQPERYFQERDLIGFFVTGLATIDSLFYGLFAIASMLDDKTFKIETDGQRRKISLNTDTLTLFSNAFPGAMITDALRDLQRDQDYQNWKTMRNILSHRSAPGRQIRVNIQAGPGREKRQISQESAFWMGHVPIDELTTATKRKWLVKTLGDLLNATDAFTAQHF